MSTLRTRKTKTDYILADLMNGRVMTHHKAQAYGTYRLAAVIHRLRSQGFYIENRTARSADGTRYTEYFMPQFRHRFMA